MLLGSSHISPFCIGQIAPLISGPPRGGEYFYRQKSIRFLDRPIRRRSQSTNMLFVPSSSLSLTVRTRGALILAAVRTVHNGERGEGCTYRMGHTAAHDTPLSYPPFSPNGNNLMHIKHILCGTVGGEGTSIRNPLVLYQGIT